MTFRRVLAPFVAAALAATGLLAIPTAGATATPTFQAFSTQQTAEALLAVKGKKCKKKHKKTK